MSRVNRLTDREKAEIRNDYRAGLLSANEICQKYNISLRTVYKYTEGIKRHGMVWSTFTQIKLSAEEIETLIIAIMEAEKVYKGDTLARLQNLENKMADKAEQLYEMQSC